MLRLDARASRGWRVALGAAVVSAAVVVFLMLAYVLDPLREGLNATFFADANWSGEIVHTMVDRHVSTDTVFVPWRGSPPETFSAVWSGAFIATGDGTYTFATASDDGSWVSLNDKLILDNGGTHPAKLVRRSVRLAAGWYRFGLRYEDAGGDRFLQFRVYKDYEPVALSQADLFFSQP